MLTVAIILVGAFRLTILLTLDKISNPLRGMTVRGERKLSPRGVPRQGLYLFTCQWCLSLWVGIAIAAGLYLDFATTIWALIPLAISGGVILLGLVTRMFGPILSVTTEQHKALEFQLRKALETVNVMVEKNELKALSPDEQKAIEGKVANAMGIRILSGADSNSR